MKDVNDRVILLLFTPELHCPATCPVQFLGAVRACGLRNPGADSGPGIRTSPADRDDSPVPTFSLPCLCPDFRGPGVGRLHDRGPASCARPSGCDRLFGLRDMDRPRPLPVSSTESYSVLRYFQKISFKNSSPTTARINRLNDDRRTISGDRGLYRLLSGCLPSHSGSGPCGGRTARRIFLWPANASGSSSWPSLLFPTS